MAMRKLIHADQLEPIEVDKELRRGTQPWRNYQHRCFERAAKYVLRHAEVPGIRLVHGRYHVGKLGDRGIGHSWVELPGSIIFDPNEQQFYDRDQYYEALAIESDVSYDGKSACGLMASSGHCGPWQDDSEGTT